MDLFGSADEGILLPMPMFAVAGYTDDKTVIRNMVRAIYNVIRKFIPEGRK
jgi:hypothetical protein